MSFSASVKADLCSKKKSRKYCCMLSELYAVLLMCVVCTRDTIKIVSESEPFIERCCFLIKKLCGCDVYGSATKKETRTGVVSTLFINDGDSVRRILSRMPDGVADGEGAQLDAQFVKKPCCRRAFLRGAFLTAGTMSDPQKGYHFEISTPNAALAEGICALMREDGLSPRTTRRKAATVIYIKESEGIEDSLNYMGATLSVLSFMEIKVERDVRNTVNRRVNFETANIGKTASAAVRQREAIETIEAAVGLDNLPESLRGVARARLENPDASLAELLQQITPPVSRSGLHHRLARLVAISDGIRKRQKQ